MAQLGIRDEHAVVNQRGADAGAERGRDNQTVLALCRTELLLGDTRRVSIIDDNHRTAARLGELLGDVHADPGLVEVRHEIKRLAGLDRRRERDTDRRVLRNFKMFELLTHNVCNGLRSGFLRGQNLQTRFSELTLLQIDGSRLDARAADVNAESLCCLNHL